MLFTISLVISLLLAVGNVTAEVVSRYEVYLPAVERYWIVNPATSKYQYNHDSSLAYYRGNWYAVWNANTNPLESQPGQAP
ncbi:MAG TPA: hypothetical protein GXX57_00125 [Firmicutes bacterium]|nr:hypothetical protein [Bacillota bacterium]